MGKFDNGDDSWLDYRNVDGEFAIAYLGLNNIKNDKQQIISDLNHLTHNIFTIQNEKLYQNEINIRDKSFLSFINPHKCGDGICVFQDPEHAENFAGIIEINKIKIKIILMCRINPKKKRQPRNYKYFWILNITPDEIRPYRILIKKIPTSALTGSLNNELITSPFPINYIISAINSGEDSFYSFSSSSNFSEYSVHNDQNLSKDFFVMKLYSSDYYIFLNNYLRDKKRIYYFKENKINSWIYCLQLALRRNKKY